MKQILGMFIGAITLMTIMYGCTENQMARNFGGTEDINLPTGRRLVNVTWKSSGGNGTGADLWILTKEDTTKPTTYYFEEKSDMGVMEGKVIIKEQ
jgi:hypothetical protein